MSTNNRGKTDAKPIKIFFDARYMRTDYHDGISRYSAELGNALAALTPVTFLICDEQQRKWLPEDAKTIKIHAPTSAKEPFSALVLNKYQPDVVYSPMQTIGSLGRRFKLILTLHDLIYYRHRTPPRQLSGPIRLGWRAFHLTYTPQRMLLNSADIVATVSHTSKKDIENTKLTKRPVIVASNAPQSLRSYLKHDVSIDKSPLNLIYMGSFMEYKNVETLIKGMEFLPEYTLHLLSRINPNRRSEYDDITPKNAKIIYHNGVSDEQYAKLLADRALLVSASLEEGYGLPVAEAMALGVPAVISDMTIFHEVGGDGALYFDARNPIDFAKKVKSASKLDEYQKLSERASAQSRTFSWEASARVLLDNIKQLTQ